MFIYNIKVNGSKIFKNFFILVVILLIIILCVVSYRVFYGANSVAKNSILDSNTIFSITPKNYTNVLKAVHDNIDDYVGKNIKFTGYVYRVLDLKDTQFVLARDMIISSNFQSVIVGFLCEYENAKSFEDGTWIELIGTITKGDYHGDMPIINVTKIDKIEKPSEEYVYPPDENYISTSLGV